MEGVGEDLGLVGLCSNCDRCMASFRCTRCPPASQLLCSGCVDLHGKIKQFRDHEKYFIELQQHAYPAICSNCEVTDSKFICRQCSESDRFLCLGCSLFHAKIKSFRGHNQLVPIDHEPANPVHNVLFSASLQTTAHHLLRWLDIVVEQILYEPFHRWPHWSLAICLALLLAYFFLMKRIFGSLATIVNVTLLIVVLKYRNRVSGAIMKESKYEGINIKHFNYNDKRSKISKVASHLFSDGVSDPKDEEFPDEFNYNLKGKPPSLRPRTRFLKNTSRTSTKRSPREQLS